MPLAYSYSNLSNKLFKKTLPWAHSYLQVTWQFKITGKVILSNLKYHEYKFIQYSIKKQKKSYGREKQTSAHKKKTTNSKWVGHKHTTYIIMVHSQQTANM